MKMKSILMATMFAAAGFIGQAAHADTLTSTSSVALESDGVSGYNATFGNSFSSVATGDTFADTYTFSIATGFDSSASLTSTYLNTTTVHDLSISSYTLSAYDATTGAYSTVYTGVSTTSGTTDTWSLVANDLTSGTYALTVTGTVVGNAGGTYAGDLAINVSPVPEPATYGMLMAGLGLMGFVARRKNKA
jgi:hypothetical protein